jgi:hypothetical protein
VEEVLDSSRQAAVEEGGAGAERAVGAEEPAGERKGLATASEAVTADRLRLGGSAAHTASASSSASPQPAASSGSAARERHNDRILDILAEGQAALSHGAAQYLAREHRGDPKRGAARDNAE